MRNLFNLNILYLLLIATETAAIVFLCFFLPSVLPLAGVFISFWAVGLIAAIAIRCRDEAPEISCSLMLLIIALPTVGAAVYLLSAIRQKNGNTLTVKGAIALSAEEKQLKATCGVGGAGYDRAVYLKNGNEFFSLLFKEISRAKKRVYLEYFIVRGGKIFDGLIEAIDAAKRGGADIRFMLDGIGSAFRLGRKEKKALRAAGASVKIFHRLTPLFHTGLNNRDHRKITVIDGEVAFTGGFNIGDEYANAENPFGVWKDTGVALYGRAAKIFEGLFLSVWDGISEIEIEDCGEKRCAPYYDSPPRLSGTAENLFMTAISRATRRVHIFTPYFCAGEKINAALSLAAMRGVDVRVIIPHIPDKKYAFELSLSCAEKLIPAGVKFYEYAPGFMHAKSMICDGKLYIGTYNFDFRSLRLNNECGVALDGRTCALAERDFSECMRVSAPLLPRKRSARRTVYRFFLKLFAPLF